MTEPASKCRSPSAMPGNSETIKLCTGYGTTFKNVGTSKVVGTESIKTEAGTFEALKIETSINGHNANDFDQAIRIHGDDLVCSVDRSLGQADREVGFQRQRR